VLAFAIGTLLVSAVLVSTTWFLARSYLLDQREAALTRQAFADAHVLASRLSTAGSEVGDALTALAPASGANIVVRSGDSWYSSSLQAGRRDVPLSLRRIVQDGDAGLMRVATAAGPHLVVGVPVVDQGIAFYEISPLVELHESLRTLAGVLGAGALAATAAGAAFGVWASRRTVQPLEQVAGAASRIGGGELTTRLAPTDDPDLVGIVAGFNSMVDALAARIERDNRFVADVSHELRSPLTSLVTTVEVLGARRQELSPRAAEALGLVETELGRFRAMLDDLLELARMDGGAGAEATQVAVTTLVREVLATTGRPVDLLDGDDDELTTIRGDKPGLQRAVRNLLDNADRYGGGPVAVHVLRRSEVVLVCVDDAGPGVPTEDRERIFERFSRGQGAARRSHSGAGLGLAIVSEAAARHGGAAWCADSPAGGARFCISLVVDR
jgi:signal transduction histidine kinase